MAIDWKFAAKAAAASLGLGLVAGLVADRVLERTREDRGYEELADEYLPELEDDRVYDIPEGVNEMSQPDGRPSFSMEKPSLDEMVDYTRFYEKHKTAKDEDESGKEGGKAPIGIISEDDFVKGTGNEDGYASVTGTWFADDGVLAGWDDHLDIKDVDTTIGRDALKMFDDPDISAVYVRNDLLEVLYEIVRGEGSYENAKAEIGYSAEDAG